MKTSLALAKKPLALKRNPAAAVAAVVAVYTPNSTSNIIDTLALVTYSRQRLSKVKVGKKKVSAQAS